MDNKPMFFKVFLLQTSSHKLDIPLNFVSCIKGALPNKALLRNRDGKLWPITISEVENRFYFEKGWAKFVEDNIIEHSDLLTFRYDGGEFFDVTLFAPNGCEKGLISQNSCAKKEMKVEIEAQNIEETNDAYVNGTDYEEEKELGLCVVQGTCTERKMKEEEQEIEKKINEGTKYRKGKKSATNDHEAKHDVKDDDVFKYGIISRPDNPYFVTKLRATRTNELYIPLDVIRDFNLEIPEKMIILDENNKEWQSKVKVWTDGRYWLTNGWKAFRKWNVLTWQDRCLCEFVEDSGPRGLFLKIRILREGSWLPKGYN